VGQYNLFQSQNRYVKTRLEFFEKLILKMNLVVKWGLGDGACDNDGDWEERGNWAFGFYYGLLVGIRQLC